jgi:PhnB protein
MNYKPDGYFTATPYLHIKGANAAIEFYKKAFDAVEVLRLQAPDGTIAHAEIKIGDSHIMLGEENADWGAISPTTLGGTGGGIMLYVENVDQICERAVEAGATLKRPAKDEFYGDRVGIIVDPFGHQWNVATHVEDVSNEEVAKRFNAMFE